MQREVRSIPPAPRKVRLRPLLAHRWPLLFVGGVLVVLGSLLSWAMFLQSGARLSYGPRLAEGPTEIVVGIVTRVGPPRHFDDNEWQQIHYTFPWRENGKQVPIAEVSFAPVDRYRIGDAAPINVLSERPNVSCVEGGVPHMYRSWLYARFWLGAAVAPGALILLGWLAGLFQLRRVLMHGDVSAGRVLAIRPVRWILPEMLVVQYEFRDHRATIRRNRHWVRAHGALGNRLLHHPSPRVNDALPVLHDRRLPQWNRILLPQDFLATDPIEAPEIS